MSDKVGDPDKNNENHSPQKTNKSSASPKKVSMKPSMKQRWDSHVTGRQAPCASLHPAEGQARDLWLPAPPEGRPAPGPPRGQAGLLRVQGGEGHAGESGTGDQEEGVLHPHQRRGHTPRQHTGLLSHNGKVGQTDKHIRMYCSNFSI